MLPQSNARIDALRLALKQNKRKLAMLRIAQYFARKELLRYHL